MKTSLLLVLVLCTATTYAQNLTQDLCSSMTGCSECIQNATCAWCNDPKYIENNRRCNDGIYKCGICECNPGFFGRRCECIKEEGIVDYTQNNCRPNNATVDCSGRGNCICGQCTCFAQENIDEVISGEFCECDNFSCDRHNGKLCSGNGDCVCGECQCNSPLTGSDCSCTASNDTCFRPYRRNEGVCSGHGECVCGRCQCENTEIGNFTGEYCENTPDPCPSRTTCHECMLSPECAWCKDPELEDESRCFLPQSSNWLYCRDGYVWNPPYEHNIKWEDPYRIHSFSDDEKLYNNSRSEKVHIAPQHKQIKLRPNHVLYKFKLFYTQIEDYPVDLQNSSLGELKDTAGDGIKISYYSNCLDLFGERMQTNKCRNMKAGDKVAFDIEIEELPVACATDLKDWKQTIQIYVVGSNASLTVDLELSCSCPWENPGDVNYIENAPQCKGNGLYKCGLCECKPGFFGRHCECYKNNLRENESIQNCRPDNATVECSGKGNCVCGQCECFVQENIDEVISGEFCECDNFSCGRHNGKLCSGNGDCVCGECKCNSGWSGSDCSCTASNYTCIRPYRRDKEVCSGHGECVCGRCQCENTEKGSYSGEYCENVPDPCPSRTTCHECMLLPECAWCTDPNLEDKSRCYLPSKSSNWLYCPNEYIWNPATNYHVVKWEDPYRVYSYTDDGKLYSKSRSEKVHIAPQHIQIKFRPNQLPYKFQLFYLQIEDYPVDLQNSSLGELKDTAGDGIKITYYSNCLDLLGERMQTNKCRNMKDRDEVAFDIEIEELPVACAADLKDWKESIQIYVVGSNASLTVELELSCSCPCENPGDVNYIENAPQCNSNGLYKCGLCECKPGFFGRHCECYNNNLGENESIQNCRPDNATVDCSGKGNCICGQCECFAQENIDEVISGEFCECDNFSCDRYRGKVCSGPDNGVCVCGECQCNSSWTGSDCSCRESNDTCIFSKIGDTEICSGHGECDCGRCKCENTDEGSYTGRYCESCPTCDGRCAEFKECVQCLMYKTGVYSEEDCPLHCPISPIAVSIVEVDEENYGRLCSYTDEYDCRFEFAYSFNENGELTVQAQSERNCTRN